MTRTIQADPLRRVVGAIFAAAGVTAEEAARVARYLVDANLVGHDSHGVVRTTRYVNAVRKGDVVPGRTIETVIDGGAFAVVDGAFGFGQTVGEQAVLRGVEIAKAHGVAVVGLRNAAHLGRVGDWAELAASHGMISVHFVNTSGIGMIVAPFGASEARMSTNPFVIGVPREKAPPLILDFATSIVAEGKVLVAISGGKPLPEGAFVGPDGSYTTDPEVIYGPFVDGKPPAERTGQGAIRAMGLHKGSGLAIMCEMLAGALTGGGAARPGEPKLANNMLSIYMAAARFDAADDFAQEVARYVTFAKSARPVQAGGEVLMPGEPEIKMRAARTRDGIPLPDKTWAGICAAAATVGVTEDRIETLLSAPRSDM